MGSLSNDDARRAWDPTYLTSQAERQVKIRKCTDLASVLLTVPPTYRGVLSDLFGRLTDGLEQRDQLTRARSKLQGLKDKGEVPFSYNSLRLPVLQYQKGMRQQWNETWLLPAQDKLTTLKKEYVALELQLLDRQLNLMGEQLDEKVFVAEAWQLLSETFAKRDVKEMYEVVLDATASWPTGLNGPQIQRSTYNPLKSEVQALQLDLPTYIRKVIDLKLDLIERIHSHGKKKAAEKRDVVMAVEEVASTAQKEAQEVVNKEVQRQLAAALKTYGITQAPSSSKKVGMFDQRFHQDPTHSFAIAECSSAGQGQINQGQEEGEEGEEPEFSQGGSPGWEQTPTPSWRRQRSQEEWEAREFKRERKAAVEALKRKPWTFGVPSSLPDEILTLPYSDQVDVLLSRAPLALLDSNRFRSSIHVQPGLDVPLNIQHDLSASLKFMFGTKIDRSLIQSAYTDLVRRIRWKWHFLLEGGSGDDYDPDYDVVKELDDSKKKQPETAHPHIERGLQAGQDYVSHVMTLLPDADNSPRVPIPLNLERARKFVVANNLIVTSTDKNLGVAVFKREWIHSQAEALFGNEDDYTHMTIPETLRHLTGMANAIDELCETHLEDSKQLATFLSHCVPGRDERNEWANWKKYIPEAYAIPKIHKNPWKGRPICPGFCLPQNPASKVLSKTVRPFIDQIPWVIQGSKDFVKKLANIRIPPGRKAFIVSADVVAFYPSVDTASLRQILNSFAETSLVPTDVQEAGPDCPPSYAEERLDYYNRLFEIALASPVMTFNEKILAQIKGLPMGAAGSPDAANIYGYWYEQEWMDKVTSNDDILAYFRYLDDVYNVVLAETPDEALELLSFVSLGDVKLLWEPPTDRANFLDLTTWIHEDGTIHHEPFVKAMSHRERIPWSSAHPLDVKRGTFSSEISRLATLCSEKEEYLKQCEEAVNLYIGRGYPPKVVRSWLVKQQEKRWEDRVADKAGDPSGDTFFTLKTHFNEAWGSFNVGELQSRILHQWRDFNSTTIIGKRKRGRDDQGRPTVRRARVTLQGAEYPGQSRLNFTSEDGRNPVELVGLAGARSGYALGIPLDNYRTMVSKGTEKWVNTAKFLVSRKRNTQLWDITRAWNKTVWTKYMEQSGMRNPFDPLYEGPIFPNEDDE